MPLSRPDKLTDIPNEIYEDIGRFIIMGLPCGGFSARVLRGETSYEVLRPCLHALYGDSHLHELVKLINDKTLSLFHNTDLSQWRGITNPESDNYIASMLIVSGKHEYWENAIYRLTSMV